jgi:hypothetical protein
MATFAVTKNTVIANVPFLIRKLNCTGGATSLAYTHGEDRAPDLILTAIDDEGAVMAAVGTARTSATVVTLDTLVDDASTCEVYLIWLPQARIDGQSINQDNNT